MEAPTSSNAMLSTERQNFSIFGYAINPDTSAQAVKVFKTTLCVAAGGLAFSIALYGAGIGLTALGNSLATKTVCSLSLASVSQTLVTVGQAAGSVGKGLFIGITKPVVFVGYDVPRWVGQTALPFLKEAAASLATKISSAVGPCFQWLGRIGELTGRLFDWLIHEVLIDNIKMVDKFITDIWKAIVTGLVYFITNMVFPGAKGIFAYFTKVSDFFSTATDWATKKIVQIYTNAVECILKPIWTSLIKTVKNVFYRVIGRTPPSEIAGVAAGVADTFPSMLTELIANQDGMHPGEFLAQQHQILASLQR